MRAHGREFLRPSQQKPPEPPEWAGFFSAEEYAAFLGLVETYFRERGLPAAVQDGSVVAGEGADGGPAGLRFGLGNLAQMCRQRDRGEWARLIAAHFDGLEQSRRDSEEIARLSTDFARAGELLAVRLYPEAGLRSVVRDGLVCRQDLEGLLTVLVFDMPGTIQTVTAEQAAPWGRSHEELFRLGLENVRQKCVPEETEVELAPGCPIRLISGNSFLTASHALLLDRRPACAGPHGALVAVPNRHAVICCPIRDAGIFKTMGLLPPIVLGMERDGPGSISRNLYWRRDGRFLNLPYRIEGASLILDPPEEFAALLRDLGGG